MRNVMLLLTISLAFFVMAPVSTTIGMPTHVLAQALTQEGDKNALEECTPAPATTPAPAAEPPKVENGTKSQTQSPALQSPQQKTVSGGPAIVMSQFTFRWVDNGLIRSDNQSGKITFCATHNGKWTCEAVPENRSALETERAALETENAQLRAEVIRLKGELENMRVSQLPQPTAPTASSSNGGRFNFFVHKMDKNVERFRATFSHVWYGMMNMIANFQRDMMRKVRSAQAAF